MVRMIVGPLLKMGVRMKQCHPDHVFRTVTQSSIELLLLLVWVLPF